MRTEAQVREGITEIIGATLALGDDARIALDADVRDDLGADSLDVIEIIMEIEEEFDVIISDEEADRAPTVRKMAELVMGKMV